MAGNVDVVPGNTSFPDLLAIGRFWHVSRYLKISYKMFTNLNVVVSVTEDL